MKNDLIDALVVLTIQAGETNEKNGYNGYAKALAAGFGIDYLAKKDMLEVSELTEALDELRHGHSADEIYLSWPPTPASLAVEFASGADATAHFQATTPGKQEGYLIEKFDAIIRSLGTVYEVVKVHGLDLRETLTYLVAKMEYNAQRPDTATSGVKGF